MPIDATLKHPTRIELKRTYALRNDSDNTEEWALPLWALLRANVRFTVEIGVLREPELAEVIHERFVNYVYSRLIVAGCFTLQAIDADVSDEKRDEALLAAIEAVLDVSEELRRRALWLLLRICPRILRDGADPTRQQKRAIRRHAMQEGHRCYLCGCQLHYEGRPFGNDDEEAIKEKRIARAFEIEHLWSQGRGGSQHRSNLGACCHTCNNLKKHLISFADAPIEQIMTMAESASSVMIEISKAYRLPVLWRQGGCCELCETKFHDTDSESLFLARREATQPYHFFNIMAVCGECNSQHSLNGVTIRA